MTVYLYHMSGRWHLSLAPEVDARYWRRQGYEPPRACWAYASIGQAFADLRRLRGRLRHKTPRGRPVRHPPGMMTTSAWEACQSLWHQWRALLHGRSLLRQEVVQLLTRHLGESASQAVIGRLNQVMQLAVLAGHAMLLPGIRLDGPSSTWYCERCHSGRGALREGACATCGRRCVYCDHCLLLGRSRGCEPLFQFFPMGMNQRPSVPGHQQTGARRISDAGTGPSASLTAAQQRAARAAVRFVRERAGEQMLLWAVTGAGKTEMTFAVVDHVLERGGRVAIATPRKDVVNELAPRMSQAFPGYRVLKLHGESGTTWESGDLVVATTHQLLRWYQAFALIIVDEVDAYPYRHNASLQAGVQRALAIGGQQLWLTATPPRSWQRAFRRGTLPGVTIPARYHGHPLPVPQVHLHPGLWTRLGKRQPVPPVTAFLTHVEHVQGQAYVFVPSLAHIAVACRWLARYHPHMRTLGVSSRDRQRAEKVLSFRNGDTRCLVTTTILERGVTVENAHVLIMQADHPIFDEAALVQMSGRSGRSGAFPDGRVDWVATVRTRDMTRALRHIGAMNREAKEAGWLHAF